ncbi:MAG: aspartate aminotransferase family protein [Candidatus Paceibacterota bacterium]
MRPREESLYLPKKSSPIEPSHAEKLLNIEREKYLLNTKNSKKLYQQSKDTSPLGVPSSFQYWHPYALGIKSAKGAYVTDMDSRVCLDLSMGFGALQVGHSDPRLITALTETLNNGVLYVSPSTLTMKAAQTITSRFNIDMVRFTNSGTEAVMYAIKLAKTYTKRKGLLKIEGGYHGGYDAANVSTKPELALAGNSDKPNAVHSPYSEPGDVTVIPYNDIHSLQTQLQANPERYAALLMEPVLENIAISLPDENYLKEVRELTEKYGVLLILDEIKTGLTAGPKGASFIYGIEPDILTLAKSIGGGLPVGAFGGKSEIFALIESNHFPHYGTYNGNALAMQAVITVNDILTEESIKSSQALNARTITHINSIIQNYQLPAHVLGFGTKGCVTWSTTQVRNYRDYKNTNFTLSELHWLWNLNRQILTPPGLDEQWLVSHAHRDDDMLKMVNSFEELASSLRNY